MVGAHPVQRTGEVAGGVGQRPVEVERFGDGGAVLRGGLNPGELIVAAGAFRLTAGEKVRLAEEVRK